MALISARTKISRILSTLSHNNFLSRSPFFSNGVQPVDRLHPLGGFGRSFASSAVASVEHDALGSRAMGFEILGVKDYEDYRRSLYGEITHKALLVDAVGTLVVPSQPMAQVSLSLSRISFSISVLQFVKCFRYVLWILLQIYREIGEKYGVNYSEGEILNRYRRAYEKPWGGSRLRSTFLIRFSGFFFWTVFEFQFTMTNFVFIILNLVWMDLVDLMFCERKVSCISPHCLKDHLMVDYINSKV